MTDIRVGLTSLYQDKSIITIYNNNLSIGYCINNVYMREGSFSSNGGYSFEPVATSMYVSDSSFSSYNKAVLAAVSNNYKNTYPTITGRGVWKLYSTDNYDSFSSEASSKRLIKVTGSNDCFFIDGEPSGCYPQFSSDSVISLGSRKYRGRIEIGKYKNSSKLTAVNIINIEAYLLGTVTCEMNPDWDFEALKAQAVCSRSYAAAKGFSCTGSLTNPYKLTDTASSQVYKGYNSETKEAYNAVIATYKQVLKSSKGNIIAAFYYSTSGGSTEFANDIWGTNSNIYLAVPDLFETSPEKNPWSISYSYNEIETKLNEKGYSIGTLKSITPEIITSTGRVYSLSIKGSKDKISLSLSEAQKLFSLPSAKYKVINETDTSKLAVSVISSEGITTDNLSECYVISSKGINTFSDDLSQIIVIGDSNMSNYPAFLSSENTICFIGMGYGHGVGLSQSGANGMAKAGYQYEEILHYYYNNVILGIY